MSKRIICTAVAIFVAFAFTVGTCIGSRPADIQATMQTDTYKADRADHLSKWGK